MLYLRQICMDKWWSIQTIVPVFTVFTYTSRGCMDPDPRLFKFNQDADPGPNHMCEYGPYYNDADPGPYYKDPDPGPYYKDPDPGADHNAVVPGPDHNDAEKRPTFITIRIQARITMILI